MKRSDFDLIWTLEAENDLDAIYDFYMIVSEKVALKIITEIIFEADKIIFSEEFQVDDINPNYRRIIVRHFKILYRKVKNQIVVFAIFDCKQSPAKLKKLKR